MRSILRCTKEVYHSYKKEHGKYKLDTYSHIGKLKLSNEANQFLADYIGFVMSANVLSDITKIYIQSFCNKPSDVVLEHNSSVTDEEQITAKQLGNHIYYDTKRLDDMFPDDMLLKVFSNKGRLDEYRAYLKAAIDKKYGKTFLNNNSILDLSTTMGMEKPSEEDIKKFFALYAPYTKKYVASISNQIPENVVQYINYIMSKGEINDNEEGIIKRLNKIIDDEYIDF